ncbi:MAG: hypothetical protein ACOX6X_08800 [Dethiobacteria bacterium]|jgi:multisubunit Na+/H+ antiporter MnhB subunit
MAIAGILLLGIFLIAYDAPTLKREKRYRDLLVYLILVALGLTLGVLLLLGLPITSLGIQIENTITFLLEMFKKIAGHFV